MTFLEILLTILLGAMTAIVIAQWRYIVRTRRDQRNLSRLLSSLEEERPALARMIHSIKDDEARQLIRNRSELVEKILAAAVAGDPDRSNAVLDEVERLVEERTEFMRQTRLIYERIQPRMVERLRESGLDDEEVEICCLYALGLNGKAIQTYTGDSRHYQNVGIIRKKLGLGEHDRNIDAFIRSLMR